MTRKRIIDIIKLKNWNHLEKTNIFTILIVAATEISIDNTVNIAVSCEEKIDFSGIVIKIYRTVLSNYDEETDSYQFDKFYYSSMNLSEDGAASIIRPSEYFSISFEYFLFLHSLYNIFAYTNFIIVRMEILYILLMLLLRKIHRQNLIMMT